MMLRCAEAWFQIPEATSGEEETLLAQRLVELAASQ